MDARVRWLQIEWPTTTTMLELPIYLAIMGAMALVATHGFVRVQQRLHVLEAVFIVTGPRVGSMEYRAVTGAWPASNEQAGYSAGSLVKEGRLHSVLIREGGAVDFIFSNRAGGLAGKVMSVRAWEGPDGSELKGPIQEFRKERGKFPVDNTAAGVPDADKLIGNYVTRVDVHDGAISVTFGNFVNKSIEGQIVTLQPIVVKGSPASPMSWRCGYRGIPNGMEPVGTNLTNMDRRFLPSSCRS